MDKGRKAVIVGLTVLCLSLFFTSQVLATVQKIPASATIVEYGIYEDHGHQQKFTSSGTAAGTVSSASQQLRFLKQTREIPLKKGIIFGYRWRMQGFTPGRSIIITYRIKHPPIVNLKGIPVDISEGMIKVTPKRRVVEMLNGYQLTKDNELVPGTWTIITLLDNHIIAEMPFHVIAH